MVDIRLSWFILYCYMIYCYRLYIDILVGNDVIEQVNDFAPGKLTYLWNMAHLSIIYLLKMMIVHGHVNLPELR